MTCPTCGKKTRGITSRATGNILSICCAAFLGRAFDKTPRGKHENILQIIRIVKARDNGGLTREQCEAQIQAIITREPELPLRMEPVQST